MACGTVPDNALLGIGNIYPRIHARDFDMHLIAEVLERTTLGGTSKEEVEASVNRSNKRNHRPAVVGKSTRYEVSPMIGRHGSVKDIPGL